MSKYTKTGGHAPGELREVFQEVLTDYVQSQPLAPVEFRGRLMTARQLCGLLWNCTDIFPGGPPLEDFLGMYEEGFGPRSRTYAALARALSRELHV